MLTAEQIEKRRYGIGGSDAGAIIGVSPWRTPLQVYLEKTGQDKPEEKEIMEWGARLEDYVADATAARLGLKLRRRKQQLQHPLRPWMLANLDREVVGERTIAEIKTTGFNDGEWGKEWTDAIPPQYVAQVTHYMAVRDYDLAIIPVLFMAERRLRIYEVKRDKEWEDILISQEENFWFNHVLKQIPPEAVTLNDVALLYPNSNDQALYATPEMLAAVEEIRRVKEEQKRLKKREDELKKQVQLFLGNNSVLKDDADKPLITWKTQVKNSLDIKGMEKVHPRLVAEFRKEVPSRVFLVK